MPYQRGCCYLCGVNTWVECSTCHAIAPSKRTREGFIKVGTPERPHFISVGFCKNCEDGLPVEMSARLVVLNSIIQGLKASGEIENKDYTVLDYDPYVEHFKKQNITKVPHWELTTLE